MYNAFFGFRERPFKLVPDPDYLFMGKSHEIAMAHLVYAMDQGDGFVVITGEVGTGKTTLCRNFLELLNDQTESAYIFNPNLDMLSLLASICKEFGIDQPNPTVKKLLDALNAYLIKQNELGKKAILLIDEAQNLTVPNLEMIRMLSNLETIRSKLLQIILVGQPELNEKLDSHELRQLAQRISLSYYLTPLSARETAGYIEHRLFIAAQRPVELFSARACRLIHRYTKGIPRLINIVSDRALLTAYSLNQTKVSSAIVQSTIKELNRRKSKKPFKSWLGWTAWAISIAAVLFLGVALLGRPAGQQSPDHSAAAGGTPKPVFQEIPRSEKRVVPQPLKENAATAPAAVAVDVAAAPPVSPVSWEEHQNTAPSAPSGAEDRYGYPVAINPDENTRTNALLMLLTLWRQPSPSARQIPAELGDDAFFEIAARQYGLRLYRVEDNWPLIKRINLPAIIAVNQPSAKPVYLTLVSCRGEDLFLQLRPDGDSAPADLNAYPQLLHAPVFIFWKNTLGYDAIIAKGAKAQAVIAVKELLRRVGYEQLPLNADFDTPTIAAVVDFQRRNFLEADGLVGPLTKIFMINAASAQEMPRLDLYKRTGA